MGKRSWTIRPARKEDISRIEAISGRIWEGDDYVPDVIGEWLEEEPGEVLVVEGDGLVVAFAHLYRLFPDLVWLEGFRTDPAWQGQGAGRTLAEHTIEKARSSGIRTAAFSTYIENYASLHILGGLGFAKVAEWVVLGRKLKEATAFPSLGSPGRAEIISPEVIIPRLDEVEDFLRCSPAFAGSAGWLAEGWRFFPFFRDSQRALSHYHWRLATRQDERLSALLLAGRGHDGISIDFLEGGSEAMRQLLGTFLSMLPEGGEVGAMISAGGDPSQVLGFLAEAGFETWNGGKPDVFLYTLSLEA
ncbi:MAG: GNAT family N-acetyltransferase [Coprothermobacterota bacterium]|nr:GNAT family N-acetyltransferase [Coprothermobacterota bacterium]